jgi:hypothetical protein
LPSQAYILWLQRYPIAHHWLGAFQEVVVEAAVMAEVDGGADLMEVEDQQEVGGQRP